MPELNEALCESPGMSAGTLQPSAGAHGEFTGILMFHAYFEARGEADAAARSSCPTRPTAPTPPRPHLAGFEVVELPSDARGLVAPDALRAHLDDRLAGIMLTNPNTLGLFEEDILEIARRCTRPAASVLRRGQPQRHHGQGPPGDMGLDVVHLNLHKTFSTPHGGGGPGRRAGAGLPRPGAPSCPCRTSRQGGRRYGGWTTTGRTASAG